MRETFSERMVTSTIEDMGICALEVQHLLTHTEEDSNLWQGVYARVSGLSLDRQARLLSGLTTGEYMYNAFSQKYLSTVSSGIRRLQVLAATSLLLKIYEQLDTTQHVRTFIWTNKIAFLHQVSATSKVWFYAFDVTRTNNGYSRACYCQAPLESALKMRLLLASDLESYTVNAGNLPENFWQPSLG